MSTINIIDEVEDDILGNIFVNEVTSNYLDVEHEIHTDRILTKNNGNDLVLLRNGGSELIIGITGVNIGTTGNGDLGINGSFTLSQNNTPILPGITQSTLFLSVTDNLLKSIENNGLITTYQPITTVGDLVIYNNSTNTQDRLPIGTTGQILTVSTGSTAGMQWIDSTLLPGGLFGTDYFYISNENTLTFTTLAYVDYVVLPINTTVNGTFYVNYSLKIIRDKNLQSFDIRVLLDTTELYNERRTYINGTDEVVTVSSFSIPSIIAGSHTIRIQVRCNEDSSIRVNSGKIVVWRLT